MKICILILYCFFSVVLSAQKNRDSLFISNLPDRYITLNEIYEDKIQSLPFHSIIIKDARPDTTSAGFIENNLDRTFKLNLKNGLANTLSYYLNKNYNLTSDSNNLLILIKEFRVSEYAVKGAVKDLNTYQWYSGTVINVELFLSRSARYYTLYKIDSILTVSSVKETVEEAIKNNFRLIINKCIGKSLIELHIGKTAFSFNDVLRHIDDFSNFPILKTVVPNKGVYQSFNEFKNNDPSITNYEIHKGKFSDELFIVNSNQPSYPMHDCWGYCDGKNIFIYSANNFFKLIRTGDTYNIKGIKSFTKATTSSDFFNIPSPIWAMPGLSVSPASVSKFKADFTAFQLNMQTGEIY